MTTIEIQSAKTVINEIKNYQEKVLKLNIDSLISDIEDSFYLQKLLSIIWV